MLGFPGEAAATVVTGLRKLAEQYPGALHALATDRAGSRVLEAAFKPNSCLPNAEKFQASFENDRAQH
eukprot:7349186-Pyramimonas_sp.AAC.1